MKGMQIKEEFNKLVFKTFCRMVGTVIAHHYFLKNVFPFAIVLEENLMQFNIEYLLTGMRLTSFY